MSEESAVEGGRSAGVVTGPDAVSDPHVWLGSASDRGSLVKPVSPLAQLHYKYLF